MSRWANHDAPVDRGGSSTHRIVVLPDAQSRWTAECSCGWKSRTTTEAQAHREARNHQENTHA